jgi:hypothetical protein
MSFKFARRKTVHLSAHLSTLNNELQLGVDRLGGLGSLGLLDGGHFC